MKTDRDAIKRNFKKEEEAEIYTLKCWAEGADRPPA